MAAPFRAAARALARLASGSVRDGVAARGVAFETTAARQRPSSGSSTTGARSLTRRRHLEYLIPSSLTSSRGLSATPSSSPEPYVIVNHPKRFEAASVLHARPWHRLEVPALVSAVTSSYKTVEMVDGVECPLAPPSSPSRDPNVAYDVDYAHLVTLLNHFGVAPPPRGSRFHACELTPSLKLRWERHTEIQTYAFTRCLPDAETRRAVLEAPFDADNVAMSLVPKEWAREIPGGVVCATHVAVMTDEDRGDGSSERPSEDAAAAGAAAGAAEAESSSSASSVIDELKHLFGDSDVITGCELDKGRFRCFSDWRAHGDGFNRIVAYHSANDKRAFVRSAAGKAVQRMLELDKYRMLALMALPLAQGISARVDSLNDELKHVMRSMDGVEKLDAGAQREILNRLTRLAAAGLKLSAIAHDRFAASNAYAKIVDDRVSYLQMERIRGIPAMSTFITAAVNPATRTCAAAQRRLDKVANSSQLAAEIMRTSLTLEQHTQSNENLSELKKTSSTQLMMQHNVEGLSAVAITYYSLGVLGYVLKALNAAPGVSLPMSTELALGGAIPLIWGAVYVAIDKMKRAAMVEGGGKKH